MDSAESAASQSPLVLVSSGSASLAFDDASQGRSPLVYLDDNDDHVNVVSKLLLAPNYLQDNEYNNQTALQVNEPQLANERQLSAPQMDPSDLGSIVNVTKDYPFEYAVIMFGYLLPFVLVVTIITNLLVVAVLYQRHMRTPTNIVLFTMAIVDLATLLSPSPWYLYIYTFGNHNKFLYPPTMCYAWHVMSDVIPIFFHTSSIWLALLLASQRYIYVCHPTLARSWCTVPHVNRAIFWILAIALAHQIPRFFDSTFESATIEFNNVQHLVCRNSMASWVLVVQPPIYFTTYFTFRILFVHIIPCTALLTLNLLLFRALKRAENKRCQLLKSKFKMVDTDPSERQLLGGGATSSYNMARGAGEGPAVAASEKNIEACTTLEDGACEAEQSAPSDDTTGGRVSPLDLGEAKFHLEPACDSPPTGEWPGYPRREVIVTDTGQGEKRVRRNHQVSYKSDSDAREEDAPRCARLKQTGKVRSNRESASTVQIGASSTEEIASWRSSASGSGPSSGSSSGGGSSSGSSGGSSRTSRTSRGSGTSSKADEDHESTCLECAACRRSSGAKEEHGLDCRRCSDTSDQLHGTLPPDGDSSCTHRSCCARREHASACSFNHCAAPRNSTHFGHVTSRHQRAEATRDTPKRNPPSSSLVSLSDNDATKRDAPAQGPRGTPRDEPRPRDQRAASQCPATVPVSRYTGAGQATGANGTTSTTLLSAANTNSFGSLSQGQQASGNQMAPASASLNVQHLSSSSHLVDQQQQQQQQQRQGRTKSPSYASCTTGRGSRATLLGSAAIPLIVSAGGAAQGNHAQAAATGPSAGSSRTMDSNRTTLMLVVVVSVFLIVEVPVALVTITHVVLNLFDVFRDVEVSSWLDYIKLFTNFFIMISYSVNFTIYCSMSKKFRETFRDLFFCGRGKRAKRMLYQSQAAVSQYEPYTQVHQFAPPVSSLAADHARSQQGGRNSVLGATADSLTSANNGGGGGRSNGRSCDFLTARSPIENRQQQRAALRNEHQNKLQLGLGARGPKCQV